MLSAWIPHPHPMLCDNTMLEVSSGFKVLNCSISRSSVVIWTQSKANTTLYLTNRPHFPMVYTLIHRTPCTQVEARATDERFHSIMEKIYMLTCLSLTNHPNRLIVIAERDVVYSKFPIPLINRLEKHYLVTSASLSSAQRAVVLRLQEWVTRFSHVNIPLHQQMRYVL